MAAQPTASSWNNFKAEDAGCDIWGKQRLQLAVILRDDVLPKALAGTGVHTFVENGTLLGAHRNQRFIPHDDDFDFCLLHESGEAEAKRVTAEQLLPAVQRLLPAPYRARMVTSYSDKIECYDPRAGFYTLPGPQYGGADYPYVIVDLQVYHASTAGAVAGGVVGAEGEDGRDKKCYLGNYRAKSSPTQVYRYLASNVFPLGSIELEGEVFPAPGNVLAALEGNYGSLATGARYNADTGKYDAPLSPPRPPLLSPLTPPYVPEAAAVAAAAFAASPTYSFIFQGVSHEQRVFALAWLFERNFLLRLEEEAAAARSASASSALSSSSAAAAVRPGATQCHFDGGGDGKGDGEPSLACFFMLQPPEAGEITFFQMCRAGILLAPFKFGLGAFRRLLQVKAWYEKQEHALAAELAACNGGDALPYCLLERMVVVPALQGKGVGSKCLKEALDAVAGRGQGVLLATQEARNVRFYEGLGFETIHETDFHEDFHEHEHTLAGGETVTGSTGFTGLTGFTAGEPIHNWFMFKSPPGRKGYGRALVEARRVKQLKRRDAEAAAAAVGGGRAGGGRAGAVGAGWRRVSRGRVAALVAVSAGLMFAVSRRGR